MTDEATFDACVTALTTLTPYSEQSVNEALRDLAEEFPGRVWEPVELVEAVHDWIAAELTRKNLAAGHFKLVRYDHGEARYALTEAGVCRIEELLRGATDD